MANFDFDAFNALTDRQKEFLLGKVSDPETGSRYFRINSEIAKQFWFEQLIDAGWVGVERLSTIQNETTYGIPMHVWPVIAEAKARGN
ncbi:MAG: hypothetical protein OXF23_00600 [Candidatus Dadabacteria bacterium]|nr:hypothetical protein [Candidatus Dadabacteria bacterium]